MNKRPAFLFFLIICAAFSVSWVSSLGAPKIYDTWDRQVQDQLFRIRYHFFGTRPLSPAVIHVDLDDSTLNSFPQNFSEKKVFASIIKILDQAAIRAAAFDMLFPSCSDAESCEDLTRAVAEADRIYFPVILRPGPVAEWGNADPTLPDNLSWQPQLKKAGIAPTASRAFANYAALDLVAKGIGHITVSPDSDGIFRRVPLLMRTADGYIPLLSLRMVCDALLVSSEHVEVRFGSDITLRNAHFSDGRTKDITIPIDSRGRMTINYAGPWHDSFTHYSVGRLLEIAEDEDLLDLLIDEIEESLVIVSDVSTGSRDVGPVPFENYYPLSGLHANVINSILMEDFLQPQSLIRTLVLDLFLLLILWSAATTLRSPLFILVGIMLQGAFLVGAGWFFISGDTIIPMVRPSLAILFSVGGGVSLKYLMVEKEKTAIRARLANYFAPDLLQKILKDQTKLETCEKKNLSILFSDITGFTSWSSDKSAEEVRNTLNIYFSEMAKIVFKHSGTIDKYMGDGLVVFFGDPQDLENHVEMAVRAAIEMQQVTRRLFKQFSEQGGMPIRIRIGVHCGEVVVGNMGSQDRLEYTVIGANVNFAQRLESNAPVGGILVSAAVHNEVKDLLPIKPMGSISMKGFTGEHEVFEVLVPGDEEGEG